MDNNDIMFDEDSEYWTLAERALDAYSLEELLDRLDISPVNALVELQLAGVLSINEEELPELFSDDDDEL